jgi:hypothetical protein
VVAHVVPDQNWGLLSMEHKTWYFPQAGKENTDAVLRLVAARARDLGIRTAVVPSVTGYTALKALAVLSGMRLVVVIECPMAAMDAGLLEREEEIISMGGTNRGVDTAVTLRPVHVKDFFSLRINEILCRPRFDG